MTKSRDTVKVVAPRDWSEAVIEGHALAASAFVPGTLVCRDSNNLLVAATEAMLAEPVEVIWTDGANYAGTTVTLVDGTTRKRYTSLFGPCTLDLVTTRFSADPEVGDWVTKPTAGNAGKFRPVSDAELAALIDTAEGGTAGLGAVTGLGLVVGRVVSVEGTGDADFVRVRMF